MENSLEIPQKLKIQVLYDLATVLLGICTPMFVAALFKIAKRWKQPKCPSVDEWINNIWPIYAMEFHSALKKEGNSEKCYNTGEPRWRRR